MKKIIISLVFAISLIVSQNCHPKISLIWQVNKAKIWEEDWLLELLKGLEFESIEDSNFEILKNNSIIVITPGDSNKISEYFKKFHTLKYKFGVIILSDETYQCPTDFYSYAQFVFRNYWHKKFNNKSNVINFALGYKSGFLKNDERQLIDCTQRKYTWSFAGQINDKPTRTAMISHMKTVPNHFIHEIFIWADSRSLNTQEYQNMLFNSIFVPCPSGYWNIDSFRTWEALECGCIPIVEKFPLDYFSKFLGTHPFIAVDSWEQAAQEVKDLLADPDRLELRRLECLHWWVEYKQKIKNSFLATIKKTLDCSLSTTKAPFPIQFSISETKIVKEIPEKTRDFAFIIPGQLNTYIYTKEHDYYAGYQDSYYAITCKKGGWDCMRHYEILANGCIPYFIDIDSCSPNTMQFLPKELIKEAMNLEGVSYLKIDHSKFNKKKYYEILEKLLDHTRTYLSARNMAQYLLETVHYCGTGKILYLSKETYPDYLRCCTLIGLKELLGERIVDFPKIEHIYTTYEKDIKNLYGKGISYTKIVPDLPINRENIEQQIKNKEFDLIIYGSAHRGLLFHDLVVQNYHPDHIIYMCGEDDACCSLTHLHNLFLREYQ